MKSPVCERLENVLFITLGLGQPSLSNAQVTFVRTPMKKDKGYIGLDAMDSPQYR